jgi:hypothetical protein
LMQALAFIASGKYTPAIRAEGKKAAREEALIDACLFINRKNVSNDTEKTQLVALLGQVVTEGGGWGHDHEYFVPHKAVQACLGDGALAGFDQAAREGFIQEQKGGQGGFHLNPRWIGVWKKPRVKPLLKHNRSINKAAQVAYK